LLYLPHQYNGLGIHHPYYRQHILQLETLISEGLHNTPTKVLIQGATEQMRHEAGYPGYTTSIPEEILNIISPSWIRALTLFAIHTNLELRDPYKQLEPKRKRDVFLMPWFLQQGYRANDLQKLNHCRLYLQATCLSDISTADGSALQKELLNGQVKTVHTPTIAMQPHPSQLDWELWNQALKPLTSRSLQLKTKLGKWMQPPQKEDRYLYSPSVDRLYIRYNLIWRQYRRRITRSSHRSFNGIFESIEPNDFLKSALPDDCLRSTVTKKNDRFYLISYGAHVTPVPVRSNISLLDRIDQLPVLDKWTIDKIYAPDDDGQYLAQSIQQGTCIAVSDGSYKEDTQQATSAFLIEGPDGEIHRISGVNRIPGSSISLSSFRAELGGIEGILSIVTVLVEHHKIRHGSLRIGLDNLNATEQSSVEHPLQVSNKSLDMISDIKTKIAQLPIDIEFFWIKGHALELFGLETYEEKLNRICDESAKEHRMLFDNRQTTWRKNERLRCEGWSIHWRESKFTMIDKETLYIITYDLTARTYLEQRSGIHDELHQQILWEEAGRAQVKWPLGKRIWLAKHISGFSATGRVMLRRKEWTHSNCPRCNQYNEDAHHILTCDSPVANDAWITAINILDQKLQTIKTSPTIRQYIIYHLNRWKEVPCRNPSGPTSRTLQDAIEVQESIGWDQFLYGRVSYLWRDAQQEWIKHQATRWKYSTKGWTISLILHLKEIPWIMWENRNDYLFHHENPWNTAEADHVKTEIQQAMNTYHPSKILRRDQRLFRIPLDKLLNYSANKQSLWLNSIKAAYARKDNFDQRQVARSQLQDIRRYFPPLPKHNTAQH
jgi:hypothetical protein